MGKVKKLFKDSVHSQTNIDDWAIFGKNWDTSYIWANTAYKILIYILLKEFVGEYIKILYSF